MKRTVVFLFSIFYFSFIIYCPAQTVINYSFEPAVQHFDVPPGVSVITVTISGAKGGGTLGGKGASFTGICNVIPCHVLSVVVGQHGTLEGRIVGDTNGGGGGGASWVYDSNIVLYSPSGVSGLIAVAGGGGGSGYFVVYGVPINWGFNAGRPGGVDLSTNATTTDSVYGNVAGGTGGNGGGSALDAGGGAGWLSNGGEFLNGRDEANHFAAVTDGSFSGVGGFGGGGGNRNFTEAGHDGNLGGGGGGYNGGGARGGGGGSYLNGTLVGAATVSDTGNGFVTISYLPPLTQVIDIYPNPNSGVFTVNGLLLGQIVEIYDYLGQKIMSPQVVNTFIQLNLSKYANGVYLVVVRNPDGSKAGQWKVVKIQ